MDKKTNYSERDYEKAQALWEKLKEAFNAEASTYDPEAYNSRLGSIGPVEEREVMRSAWWKTLDGYSYGDYYRLTYIIECEHQREQLETGVIMFGS